MERVQHLIHSNSGEVKCSTWPEIGTLTARRCVNGYSSHCEQCNTRVVLLVRVDQPILGAMLRSYGCNTTLILLHPRGRQSFCTVSAVRNTWVSVTETRVVADADCMIMACKCISQTVWLWPLNLFDHSLQVYLQTCSITASKFTQPWPPSVSPNMLEYNLRVHLYIHLITVSMYISKYSQLPPASASPRSLNPGLGVHIWVHLNVIFRCNLNCCEVLPIASPDMPFLEWEHVGGFIDV
jgi:hypothetical protein